MTWYLWLAAAAAGYLLGSIPVGYLVVYLMKGEDIRRYGSGRTGGTNALRAGGTRAGILTGAGDILKGIAAVVAVRWLAGPVAEAAVVAGVAAVVGHNWSLFMGFRGGAGTGPNVGVCMAIWPLSAVWLLPLLPFGLNVIGYASLTSLIIAAVIPVTLAIRAALGLAPWSYVVYGLLAAMAVTWSLRPNIKRLLNGTEPRAPRLLLR